MPGLWKAWKAKGRLSTLIPTAPAMKADGKVENQNQVSHFPTAANSPHSQEKARLGGPLFLRRSGKLSLRP